MLCNIKVWLKSKRGKNKKEIEIFLKEQLVKLSKFDLKILNNIPTRLKESHVV